MRGHQQFSQFHLNPLRTDLLQGRCQRPDCRLGVFVDLVAQLCGKSDRPHDAQGIFSESFLWVAHTADQLRLNVF